MTVIELMVVIAIAAILIGLAIPSMKNVLDNQKLASVNNDLITALAIARSEAVRQKKHVTICSSSNGSTCKTGATGIADWTEGWIVFANTSSGNLSRDTANEPLLSVFTAPKGISSITLSTSAGSPTLLSYRPNGTIGNIASNQQKLFTVCDNRGADNARSTLINRAGKAKAAHTGFAGDALQCPS